MDSVGIRELKEQASEILRRVREESAAYEITYHGRVIARLVPVEEIARGKRTESPEEFWAGWDKLAAEIGRHLPPGTDAVEAVREQRREL
ncbi:MAG: hypothetical protein A3F84_18980 [Candidatus Handelsmanbacteria bacterium RIFCSPLOWO2_12_FULL_64_10]|uniref:Antitoxin n=1 Tax=Handelsmanbacteria sp. (strain RIFCSPLOWO2_12_FULL_64_10) TaxID=1817868 RepID=A0A1F6D4L9_HANXR|nr:MAG: hypothetical protein A3F84_18980 [Candidatus Handelsmanbacteria bacterium RIFCSPLOWO2_12_FULL_64_10]